MKAERALLTAGIWRRHMESAEDLAISLAMILALGIWVFNKALRTALERKK